MDAVYLYKRTNSDELLFSIRLLQKYYNNLGKIWVIGDRPPKTIADEIEHVFHRSTLTKWGDQLDKIRRIAQYNELSEDFILLNDDFFVTSDYTPQLLYNNQVSLESIVMSRTHDQYHKSLQGTIEWLEENELGTANYELHVPMLLNKALVNSLMANIEVGRDLQFRSVYGNSYPGLTNGGITDVKNIPIAGVNGLLSTSNVKFNKYRKFLEGLL